MQSSSGEVAPSGTGETHLVMRTPSEERVVREHSQDAESLERTTSQREAPRGKGRFRAVATVVMAMKRFQRE